MGAWKKWSRGKLKLVAGPCYVPRCTSLQVIPRCFCKKHLEAPREKREEWISRYLRKKRRSVSQSASGTPDTGRET